MTTRFFTRLASQESVVLHLEDVHWADEASLDLLNELAEEHPTLSLLIVYLARPSLLERRATWGSGQSFHKRILLEPLDKRQSRDLVREILKNVPDLPKELRDLIVERAEGNPFYMEEVVKMLIEDRVILKDNDEQWRVDATRISNLRVPPTLMGLLQARQDTLLQPEKLALQRAAVIGRIFYDSALQALDAFDEVRIDHLPAVLEKLIERDFIHQRENTSFAGSREYIFAQAMMRDVVYDTLLKRQLKAYHSGTAHWLIKISGERLAEYTTQIAEHYEKAGEDTQAVDFLTRAGKRALQVSAFRDALRFFERALSLLPDDPSTQQQRLDLHIGLGDTLFNLSDYPPALNHLNTALTLAKAQQIPTAQARALSHLARTVSLLGDNQQAQVYLEEALPLARAANDSTILAAVLQEMGGVYWLTDRLAEGRLVLEECLQITRSTGNDYGVVHALNRLGIIAFQEGSMEEGGRYFDECYTLSLKIGSRMTAGLSRLNKGEITRLNGDYEGAKRLYLAAMEIFKEIENASTLMVCQFNLGLVALMQDKWQEAQPSFRDVLSMAKKYGEVPTILSAVTGFAGIRALAGDTATAGQWLGMIHNHPAADANMLKDTEVVFEILRRTMKPEEIDALLVKGKRLDLDAVVDDLLAVAVQA